MFSFGFPMSRTSELQCQILQERRKAEGLAKDLARAESAIALQKTRLARAERELRAAQAILESFVQIATASELATLHEAMKPRGTSDTRAGNDRVVCLKGTFVDD